MDAIQTHVPACPPLQRKHIWLAEPPTSEVHPDMWLVVCMAALTAMDYGRKRMHMLHMQRNEQNVQQVRVRQTQITDFFEALSPPLPTTQQQIQPPPPPTPLQAASASAVTQFWMCLHNFAQIGLKVQSNGVRSRWQRDISANHPLLSFDAGNGRLVVNGGP